jgi:hypothetical protein
MGKKAKEEAAAVEVSKDELTSILANFGFEIGKGAVLGYALGASIGSIIDSILQSAGVPVQINGASGAAFGGVIGALKACGKTFSWLYEKYNGTRERILGGYMQQDLGYSLEYINDLTGY